MSYLSILAKKGVISEKNFAKLDEKMVVAPDEVEKELSQLGVSKSEILKSKGEYYGLPVYDLGGRTIPYNILKYIPEESARHYSIAPLALKDGALELGIVNPDNIEAKDAINFIASKHDLPFKLFLISSSDLDRIVNFYKGLSGEVSEALKEYEEYDAAPEDLSKAAEEIKNVPVPGEETTIIEEAPVTKIVATILRYATEGNASDVHVEPMRERVRVRFRVDGILHTSLLLPLSVHMAVVARIKVLSTIKLDEKRKPQDGRFSARIGGRKIDIRVSTFPSSNGEKIVLRILDRERGVKTIDDVGMADMHLQKIDLALKRPYGLILISGPTGSGKSTTLYALLKRMDREKKNIVSLEDPVEYNIDGVAQSQIRPEIGFTFASGIRHILRQDPDVIMVGEIRDRETASLAIQAALTGHLVLSTIHTNSAIGVIPRLVDMGIDPYLIAPTLNLVMAQRLVRTLCDGAGEEVVVDGSLKQIIDKQFSDLPESYRKELPVIDKVYKAKGIPGCPMGMRGRTGIFEMFTITKELEKIILTDATEPAVYKYLREKQGMLLMKEDAILKTSKRIIPFEEVNSL